MRRLCAVLFAAVAAASPASAQPVERPSVVESRIDLWVQEIYDVASWAQRIPYEVALPRIARSKIRTYVEDLDLDEATRTRVLERLDSRGFVDELVPFVLALRDVYAEPENGSVEPFDTWLRRMFRPDDAVAGFEHSMFAWQPKSEEDSSEGMAAMFDADLAARLVEFYDALYLREAGASAALDEQLACARRNSEKARAPAARRVQPVVRKLLQSVRKRVDGDGEIAAALDGVLADPESLEAVSFTVVHFLDMLVCRHYRIFATELLRERQLEDWMLGELDKPGGGRLWQFVEDSEKRRHAVLIVVDGLQGKLVQALSTGEADDRFLRRVLSEYESGLADRVQGSKPAPPQQIDFLRAIVGGGIRNDAYLPFFGRLFAQPQGLSEIGVSTTPTISVRNLPIAKTGAAVAGPQSTSIPNFHFVDRTYVHGGENTGRAYYFYGNDALQLETLAAEAGMRSLFSRFPARNTFSCAAQYDEGAHYRVDAFLNLALGEGIRDFGELRCFAELRRRAAAEVELRAARTELLSKRAILEEKLGWHRFLRKSAQRDERKIAAMLIAQIAELEQRAMPELLVYYNPWPDHFAHFTGPFADEILAPSGELNRLDYWLGELEDTYRRAGVFDRTLFAMSGDHGLTPVFHIVNPEVEVFEGLEKRGHKLRVVKISSDEGEGPKLTHPLDPPSMRGYDAVVASTAGGNYMIDLFVDQGDAWRRQPVLSELRRLDLIGGDGPIDMVQEISNALAGSLDYMVVRVRTCDVDGGEIAVIGHRRGQRIEGRIARHGDRVFADGGAARLLDVEVETPYEVLSSAQKAERVALTERCLRVARREDSSTWCTESEWRLLTSYTPRPGSVGQLAHLYDTDRAGTVNLFPRMGVGYNTVVPGRHAGESFHEKDAFAGVWGKPVRRSARPRIEVIGAVPATVYSFLAAKPARAGKDGWGYDAVPLSD